MTYQPQLFDRDVKWYLGRRTPHVVMRRDATGYTIRVRWSDKLGLQLDRVFPSKRFADEILTRIQLAGFITPVNWKRIYHPKWTPSCRTLHKS